MYRINVWDSEAMAFVDSGEGPFPLYQDALRFANAEIGVEYDIKQQVDHDDKCNSLTGGDCDCEACFLDTNFGVRGFGPDGNESQEFDNIADAVSAANRLRTEYPHVLIYDPDGFEIFTETQEARQ